MYLLDRRRAGRGVLLPSNALLFKVVSEPGDLVRAGRIGPAAPKEGFALNEPGPEYRQHDLALAGTSQSDSSDCSFLDRTTILSFLTRWATTLD